MWWYCVLLLYPCFISSCYGKLNAENFITELKTLADVNLEGAINHAQLLDENATKTIRQRRNTRQVVGKATEENPHDCIYMDLAKKSLNQYLRTSRTSNKYKVVRVVKVMKQIVSGALTNIDFKVALVDCPLGGNSCLEVGGYAYQNCHSEILTKAWLNQETIAVNCDIEKHAGNQLRQRRGIVGGIEEKDPSNSVYTDLAQTSLAQFMRTSGTSETYGVIEVVKVTEQLVSGTLINIYFKIMPTYCITHGYNPAACKLFSQKGNCRSEIWTVPWLNQETITVDCDVLKQNVLSADK